MAEDPQIQVNLTWQTVSFHRQKKKFEYTDGVLVICLLVQGVPCHLPLSTSIDSSTPMNQEAVVFLCDRLLVQGVPCHLPLSTSIDSSTPMNQE
ncbi:hypothetical protein NFI96_017118, partial [Prochilodus magdalenae]